MQEYVELLRAMLTTHAGRSIDHQGEYYDVAGYQKWTTPVREEIPILVGGCRPAMIRLAGGVADGFIGAALNSTKFFDEVVVPAVE